MDHHRKISLLIKLKRHEMSDSQDCILICYLALTRRMKQRYADNLLKLDIAKHALSQEKRESGNLSI